MNKEFVTELTKLVDNMNALKDMGVEESNPLYLEQLNKVKEITTKASDDEFDQDMENVVGKIPDVESVVESDEVTAFKNQQFENLMGMAKAVAPQDMSYESTNEDDEEEAQYVTDVEVESAIGRIVSDINFNKSEQKRLPELKEALYRAIDKVISSGAHSIFFLGVQGETVEGTITPYRGGFELEIQGNTYTLTPEYYSASSDTEPVRKYSGYIEETEELIQEIDESETSQFLNATEYLSEIEKLLDTKKDEGFEFVQDDYDLMRYYLKQFSINNNSLEEVSNRGLELAWNYRKLTKTYN